jgi:hypothetical protein
VTSTTDTAGHPDVAEISDLTEGLLAPDRTADVRQHLETCELCADVQASLEEIRSLLGSVSGAARMPADVAGRIDAALAAEALLSASAPDPRPAQVAEETESGGADSEAHVSRETSVPSDRPAGRPQATTGPGRQRNERGRRRRRVVLGTVLTAAVLGAGSLVLQSLGDHSSDTAAHGKPTPSAGPFSGASVQSQVKDLLAGKKTQRSGIGPEHNAPSSAKSAETLLQTQPAIPECVRQAINSDGDVLAAKTGTYTGKSAYLVVVNDAANSARVTAYIIDAACLRQQPASSGTVLLKSSYPRP